MEAEQKQDAQPQPNAYEMKIKPEYLLPHENRQRMQRGQSERHGVNAAKIHNVELCQFAIQGQECKYANCKRCHSITDYLKQRLPLLETACPFYQYYGLCPYGYNCRYSHPDQSSEDNFFNPRFGRIKTMPNKDFQGDFDYQRIFNLLKGSIDVEPDYFQRTLPEHSLILAPMCSVGTIPFRRLCKYFGADITCSEMVLCKKMLQNDAFEMKKLRKSPDEDTFVIQLTGTPDEVKQVSKFVIKEALADFIDINAACPQDAAVKYQCGFAIAQRPNKIHKIFSELEHLNGNFSLKTRIGDFQGHDISDRLISEIEGFNCIKFVTIHGRSAKLRYSKLADWGKMSEFAIKLREKCPGVQFVGNGDIFYHEDCQRAFQVCDSVLIGRGALVKPWIFKEIKEGKVFDYSSAERLEIYKLFGRFCTELYGSDLTGVRKARNQFLENWAWMSRYIPVGICQERQQLNQRCPACRGRDELETLMMSQDCADWVKISEMIFGPVEQGFEYQPRYSNRGKYEKDGQKQDEK